MPTSTLLPRLPALICVLALASHGFGASAQTNDFVARSIDLEHRFAARIIERLDRGDERTRAFAAFSAALVRDPAVSSDAVMRAAAIFSSIARQTSDPVLLRLAAEECGRQDFLQCDSAQVRLRWLDAEPDNAAALLTALVRSSDTGPIGYSPDALQRIAATARYDDHWRDLIGMFATTFMEAVPEADAFDALAHAMGIGAAMPLAWPMALSRSCPRGNMPPDAERDAACMRIARTVLAGAQSMFDYMIASSMLSGRADSASAYADTRDAYFWASLQPFSDPASFVQDTAARQDFNRFAQDVLQYGERDGLARELERKGMTAHEAARRFRTDQSQQMAGLQRALNESEDKLRARQQRLDDASQRALRDALSARDERERAVAGFVVAVIGPFDASDGANVARALIAELDRLGTITKDPMVAALAAQRCATHDKGCPAARALLRWREIDSRNAAPWIALAGVASARGDRAAALNALRFATAMPKYNQYPQELVAAWSSMLMRADRTLDRVSTVAFAYVVRANLARMPADRLAKLCPTEGSAWPADIDLSCRRIAERLYADAPSLNERDFALRLLEHARIDPALLERRKIETTTLRIAVERLGIRADISQFGISQPPSDTLIAWVDDYLRVGELKAGFAAEARERASAKTH